MAQEKIQRAKDIVESKSDPKDCVATAGNILMLSPISDNLVTNGAKVHFELSSAPIGPTGKATYPKTPHPKHGNDKGPQLASTPLQDDRESISMVVSPHAIDFSGIESDVSSCKKGGSIEANMRKKKQHVLSTEGKQPLSEDNLPGLPQGGGKAFQESDTFELLESMLGMLPNSHEDLQQLESVHLLIFRDKETQAQVRLPFSIIPGAQSVQVSSPHSIT